MNSFFFERSSSYAICCGLALSFIAVSAVQAEEVARTIAAYTNADGELEYTAEAPNETVSFDSGVPIVWGTSFTQNRANFNPYSVTDVLTIVNPLVVILNSQLNVARGTAEFSGGLTPCDSVTGWAYNTSISKTGVGTAKFTSAVNFSASNKGPRFDVNEGVAQFTGNSITHQLADLYVGNASSGGASVIFDNTSVNFINGCHIAFESGKYGEMYSTNSTVEIKNSKDMNLGSDNGHALYAMKGGSLTTHHLNLGMTPGSTAVVTNDGGTITVTGRLRIGSDERSYTIGDGGSGTFVIDGGTVLVKGNGYLGSCASGSSTIEVLGGGSLTMTGGFTYFGYATGSTHAPTSVLKIDNGTASFTQHVYFGYGTAANSSPSSIFKLTNGTVSFAQPVYFGYSTVANSSPRSILNIGEGGTFKSTYGTLVFGQEAGNIARLEMDGGMLAAAGATLGGKGSFRGTMTDGNIEIYGTTDKYNFFLGFSSSSVNRFDMMGGTFTVSNSNYRVIGYNYGDVGGVVTSVLTVARSAVFSTGRKSIYLGMGLNENATAHGEINLLNGGTIEALSINPPVVWGQFGTRRLTSDGGTFRVTGSVDTYIGAANLETYVGRRGVTFDTGNYTTTVQDFASDGKSPGQIRKIGSGTLILGKLPQTHGGIAVQQGTLRLSSGATVGAAYTPESGKIEAGGNTYPENASEVLKGANYLLHRWSFNCGSLYDSVAAKKATIYGDIEPDVVGAKANLISTVNRSDISTYLDLGSGLFGDSDGDFTVEFWVNRTGMNDGKLVTIGRNGDSQTEFYINTQGQTLSRVDGKNGFQKGTPIQLGEPAIGTMYHYSVVFKRNANGSYDTTICRRNSAGEVVGNVVSLVGAIFSPHLHADTFCFAATPAHPKENTRGMDIDEVRIWKAALSEAQLTKNAQLGPDELPLLNLGMTTGPLSVAEGATFDLGGNTISYGSLTGSGTVSNGTLTLTDTLETQGLTVGANGVLDLTQATVVCSDAEGAQVVDLVSVRDGGKVVGPVKASRLPKGYMLRQTESGVSAVKCGFIFIVK